MTSAKDITTDLFLPAIRKKGPRWGIFMLCPYSTEAFSWGLALSGIEGALITFCKGDCLNHEDFTKADIGIKENQTFIEETQFDLLQTVLTNLAQINNRKEKNIAKYIFRNNVYQVNGLCSE